MASTPGDRPLTSPSLGYGPSIGGPFVDYPLGVRLPQVAREEIPQPEAGKLAPQIERLILQVVQEISNLDENPVEGYIEMLRTSPIIASAMEVKILLGLSMMGEYTHPEEEIQAFVRRNFEQMRGSLALSVAEMLSSMAIGFSFSEWAMYEAGDQWMLDSLQILDPRYYRFRGHIGKIDDLVYRSMLGNIYIPYWKGVHIVNSRYLCFGDPYGHSECRRAIAAYKAWKIVVSEMLVAAQRQATPIIVGQAPSDESVPLFDEYGNPLLDASNNPVLIPAPIALLKQLQNLDNRSVISTDLKNQITALNQQSDGKLFLDVLRYMERLQLLSFLVPETIFGTAGNGTGDSNLNFGHRQILSMNVGSTMNQIKEGLIENLIRPLVFWNYGEQETYGGFPEPEQDNVDRIALFAALGNAIAQGSFSASDLDVINKMRRLAGIPEIDKIMAQLSRFSTNYWQEVA